MITRRPKAMFAHFSFANFLFALQYNLCARKLKYLTHGSCPINKHKHCLHGAAKARLRYSSPSAAVTC